MIEPAAAKRALRTVLRDVSRTAEAGLLCDQIAALPLPPGLSVAGFWALPGEPDLREAWRALHARGHAVLLPETTPRGEPLRFRRWEPDAAMLAGRYGTAYPDGPPGEPELLFVPLLGWDDARRRLGYGGGYYDRTLAAGTGAMAVGIGTEAQRVAVVPCGPHDRVLDAVLTERRLVLEEGVEFADLVSGRHRRP